MICYTLGMSRGDRLVLAAAILCAATLGMAVARPAARAAGSGPAGPLDDRAETPAPNGAYLGSAACATCHEAEHSAWTRSLHVRMTKPIAEAVVVGDFSPDARFEAHGRAYRFETLDGRYFVSVSHGGRPFETFEVHYTLGFKRFQGYLSTLPDGRIYVLPAFWQLATRRWLDWKEISPVPDTDHDIRQIWNVTCFNCHATNLVRNFDAARATYDTSWTEMGIGCEACHGPGEAHVALMARWKADPDSKPAYDTSARHRELGRLLRIFSPRTADSRAVFDACGYCHGNKNNVFVGFVPGDRYADYATPFLMSQPLPDNDPQGEFWPDGRPSRFNRPQALTLSGCFRRGAITCTDCHVAHGSRHEHSLKVEVRDAAGATTVVSDGLCTQCHTELGQPGARTPDPALEAHSHHAPGSPGSRCVDCHMSDVNWRLLIRRRDHTFAAPVPEMTARYGVPNACTTCHDDRTPEWAAGVMDGWYRDGGRRRATLEVADAMYLAGAGDVAALPGLARLAVDRTQGILLRASAAEFIGRLLAASGAGAGDAARATADRGASQTGYEEASGRRGSVAPPADLPAGRIDEALRARLVNVLIGAASDPEPVVRASAVRALDLAGDPRAVTPLAARLVDPVRVVRARAAEALLRLGVVTLDGAPGVALARAQDEYAESLRTFPDEAGDHASLGWLEMARGRPDVARRELETAIRLAPEDPRPLVYLGVMEARAERYEEAIRAWRAARALDAAYPNIDRLIAEAQKRRRERVP